MKASSQGNDHSYHPSGNSAYICRTFNTKHFQSSLHFDELDDKTYADIKGNVSAMVQIGSVAGALLAFLVADRIGRLWATRQLCMVWILGIIIFLTNNGRLGQVYAGRFIAGIGVSNSLVPTTCQVKRYASPAYRPCCYTPCLGLFC